MSQEPFNFSDFTFGPVIDLPEKYEVFDFTQGYDPNRERMTYGVGKYDENRVGMYTTDQFSPGAQDARTIHIGIDIAAPIETPVMSFYEGEIYLTGINGAAGDYGGTLITKHKLGDRDIYALFGHLAHRSLDGKKSGQKIKKGEIIAFVGAPAENGGWNPHLHFQLSWRKPEVCDLPGTVSLKDRDEALRLYPDPRLVLGPLYR